MAHHVRWNKPGAFYPLFKCLITFLSHKVTKTQQLRGTGEEKSIESAKNFVFPCWNGDKDE